MVNNYTWWKDFWGSAWRRTNPYGTPGDIYTKGYHRGEDIANNGATCDVPALRDGEVIDSGRSNMIGFWTCVKPDEAPDRRDIYCHMYEPSTKRSGRVTAGDSLGRTAGWGESPGSGWNGPHLHYVISNLSDGGYNTSRPDYDPRPVIQAALAAAVVEPNQRVAGPYGSKARLDPSTNQAAVEEKYLMPGTPGTFDGWIRGQDVEGNNVWFRGAYSGLFFWSGGFTDAGTHDLADLNQKPLGPKERRAVEGGSKARVDWTTDQAPVEAGFIPGGDKATFDGWRYGESVNGNNVWFHRPSYWHWSGGFTDVGTHDLSDMNPKPEPEPDRTRAVGENTANIRDLPWRSSPALGSSAPGAVVTMNAWAHADDVDGNNVWFRRNDGDWQWSGGFTSQSTAGLPEVQAPPEPAPPSKYNPLGLPEYEPVYPRAVIGLEAPLGFEDCKVGGSRSKRTEKGVPPNVVPTSGILDRFIIHWAWPAGGDSDIAYFSTCNDRGSCPTIYVTADGEAIEFIRPGAKPAATGKDWNWRSWAVEVEPITSVDEVNVPSVTDAQIDDIIEQMVFLRERTGTLLDGAVVDFHLDREHVLGHSDVANVACPGKYLYDKIPWMIEEAQRRYDERHPTPEPGGGTLDPAEYPSLWSLRNELDTAFGSAGP